MGTAEPQARLHREAPLLLGVLQVHLPSLPPFCAGSLLALNGKKQQMTPPACSPGLLVPVLLCPCMAARSAAVSECYKRPLLWGC